MADDPPVDPADVDSLDAILNALYASVSFAAGERPDWPRFRALFQPRALLIRATPSATDGEGTGDAKGEGSPPLSNIEDYVTRTTAAIDSGALTAFTERELSRRTEVFADIAQIFSAYERSADEGEVVRGINSLSLVKSGGRWWIVALAWTDERSDAPLPSRYLR